MKTITIILLSFCILLLTSFKISKKSSFESKATKMPWEGACKSLGYAPLKFPTSSLQVGWVIRKKDQQPFFSDCITGNCKKGNSFSSYSESKNITTEGDMQATLGSYASAIGSFSSIKSIVMTIEDLREDYITDIKPNTTPKCILPTLEEMTNIKSLLSFQKVSIKVNVKTGVNLKAKVDSIQSKLGIIDAGASFSRASDDIIDISGANLYIGYVTFATNFKMKITTINVDSGSNVEVGFLPSSPYTISYNPTVQEKDFTISCGNPFGLSPNPFKLSLTNQEIKFFVSDNLYSASLMLLSSDAHTARIRLTEWITEVGDNTKTKLTDPLKEGKG